MRVNTEKKETEMKTKLQVKLYFLCDNQGWEINDMRKFKAYLTQNYKKIELKSSTDWK